MAKTNFPCPVCTENGHDSTGNHLFLLPKGDRFICNRVNYHPDNQYYYADVGEDGQPVVAMRDTLTGIIGGDTVYVDEDQGSGEVHKDQPSDPLAGILAKEPKPIVSKRQNVDIKSLPTVGMRGMPDEQYIKYGCKTELNETDRTPQKYYYPLRVHGGGKVWKIRVLDPKGFFLSRPLGKGEKLEFMGQHLYTNQKQLLITEGQDDAIAADYLLNPKRTPDAQVLCVSVPNGANEKAFVDNMGFLEKFDRVIFDPDEDEAGQELIEKVVSLLPSIMVMKTTEKDACDMLKEKKHDEYTRAFIKAGKYRPPSIVEVSKIAPKLATPLAMGLTYPWDDLTKMTYGMVPHQIVSVGSGPGAGKSSVIRAIQQHLMFHHGKRAGIFSLEDNTEMALRYLVGYMMNERIHIPGAVYDGDKAEEIANSLEGRAYFYDNRYFQGEWANVEQTIRYMYADGVSHFFIDPISALAAHLDSSQGNTFINSIMILMSRLIQELPIYIMLVNHLNNPATGKSHEEGGKVLASQFTGSRGQWRYSTDMWGFERDLLNEDDETLKNTMNVRILKHRADGSKTGKTTSLRYNKDTGRLEDMNSFNSVTSGVPVIPSTPKPTADTMSSLLGDSHDTI